MATTPDISYQRMSTRDSTMMRKVIVKQGYLRKVARRGGSIRGPQRRWFVFGVVNNSEPFLEYYDKEDSTFTGTPINMFFLDSCKKVVRNKSVRHKNMFTIVLADRDLMLIAETRVLMDEWCAAISQKLSSLGIFIDDDGEHEYVMNPVSRPLTQQQRKTFYSNRPVNEISCDRSQSASIPKQTKPENNANQGESDIEQQTYEATRTGDVMENSYAVPAAEHATVNSSLPENGRHSVFMEDQSFDGTVERRNTLLEDDEGDYLVPVSPTTPSSASWVMFGDTEGHPISPVTPRDTNHSTPNLRPLQRALSPPTASDHDLDISLMTPKMREASGLPPTMDEPMVVGWNSPPPDSDAPPLYVPHSALERGANQSLKHSQMAELKAEIDNPGGVKINLKRADCLYAIAFVDCFQAVWVAGWNQRARPHLHNAFHIGDKVVSINGQVVESSKMAMKLIKHCPEISRLTFILKRIPNAKLLAMRRSYEGESLGIRRNGGTAEVLDCDEMGPAGRAGLTVRTLTQSGDGFTNWWITEINHRPLNLFFKRDEIEKRLNAVGLDISAVVQPMDFIQELKKKLKGYRNFKDFLVQ